MTLSDFRKNYVSIRRQLLIVKDPKDIKLLFRQLDFTLIQINQLLNAAPSVR